MGQSFGALAPQLAAMLVGALVPTLGVALVARSRTGRARLSVTTGGGLAVRAFLLAGIVTAAGYWAVGPVLDAARGGGVFPGPLHLGVLGAAIGTLFALPNVVLIWMDERAKARQQSKRRDFVPTRDDRRAFAADLAKQIRELSSPPRDVEVTVGGDGDRVLMIHGPLEAEEGERLTAALRGDLEELGFKRLEGSGGRSAWWTRV